MKEEFQKIPDSGISPKEQNAKPRMYIKENKAEFQFSFSGKTFRAKIFPITIEEFNDKVNEKGDVVMMFNRIYGMQIEKAKKALERDGLYFDNRL